MLFCDAHLHAACCRELEKEPSSYGSDGENSYYGASCAHFIEEFARQKDIVGQNGGHILPFFGMHPQLPLLENADFMESLLQRKEIRGIGETGFDLFTEEFKANIQAQEEAWQTSLALAAAYSVPAVVHDRKALDHIFRDAGKLKALPAVIFHSFAFGPREAFSILKHGINAYFSFAKQILNGNKKSRACVQELPLDRLLLETDAPYQTLRGEETTGPWEIRRVYEEAAAIRGTQFTELCPALQENFMAATGTALAAGTALATDTSL
ncbi:MAG: TatD family hydrolase [Treponema sp.]|nr:TatD family hydrolase [Treponema sp.]